MSAELLFEERPGEPAVRGFLHRPAVMSGPGLVITHGAGANCSAPLLVALADAFAATGWLVLRCDLPFRQVRPHGPPRGSAVGDQQGLRRAVVAVKAITPGPIFLGGHSYGGRQASMLAASERSLIAGLLLLSYPLHPPTQPANLRTAHFPRLFTPALFVQGTRDTFASIAELEAAMKLIPAPTKLLAVEGAAHSLFTRANQAKLPNQVAEAAQEFFNAVAPEANSCTS
jgi:predicted alpha/beta-hydrolase family hydrolase